MFLRTTVAVLLAIANTGAAHVLQPVDWTGGWTSANGQDVQVMRNTHGSGTARGWNAFVEMLALPREYVITIAQSADEIVVSFPSGASNMLTIPGFAIDPAPRVKVVNRGDWWTKHVTSGRWVGTSLELTSTTFSGWWKNSEPDRAEPKPTDFRMRLTLTPGLDANELKLRVFVSDEKGELEYIQTFRRKL